MSEVTYTVRQLATTITGSQDEKVIEKAVRQIRYWTTENILKPLGKKHGGSGVHRLYSENEMYKAVLIAEMVRHGISVTQIAELEDIIEDFYDDEIWELAINGERVVYFVQAQAFANDQDYISTLTLRNPLYIFEHEGTEMKFKTCGTSSISYQNYTTCIVINVTRLFQRVRPRV
tara:strand:- start:1693 stop:2217 length:525 start_codon:yes stop_codon:yes gene_type:complete